MPAATELTNAVTRIGAGLTLAALLFGALPAPAAPAQKPLTLEGYLQKLGYGAIPLERGSQNNLYVRGKVQGKSRVLLIDTGFSVTTLDTGIARKLKTTKDLGVKLEDQVWEHISETNRVIIQELELGKTRFLNQPAQGFALRAQGLSYDGVLGTDFFMRNYAIVDCAAKRLYVLAQAPGKEAAEALRKTLAASGYHPAPLEQSAALVLTAQGRINGVPVKLAVDTGATYTTLDNQTAGRCRIVWQNTGHVLAGVSRGSVAALWSGAPQDFELGGARVPVNGINIAACELESWKLGGDQAKPDLANGLLGADLLGRSEAVIDYGSQTLWFVPAKATGTAPAGKQ